MKLKFDRNLDVLQLRFLQILVQTCVLFISNINDEELKSIFDLSEKSYTICQKKFVLMNSHAYSSITTHHKLHPKIGMKTSISDHLNNAWQLTPDLLQVLKHFVQSQNFFYDIFEFFPKNCLMQFLDNGAHAQK